SLGFRPTESSSWVRKWNFEDYKSESDCELQTDSELRTDYERRTGYESSNFAAGSPFAPGPYFSTSLQLAITFNTDVSAFQSPFDPFYSAFLGRIPGLIAPP